MDRRMYRLRWEVNRLCFGLLLLTSVIFLGLEMAPVRGAEMLFMGEEVMHDVGMAVCRRCREPCGWFVDEELFSDHSSFLRRMTVALVWRCVLPRMLAAFTRDGLELSCWACSIVRGVARWVTLMTDDIRTRRPSLVRV